MIREDIYLELKRQKQPGESFSQLIERLLDHKPKPTEFFGIWDDLTPTEERDIIDARSELRQMWSLRER